MMIICFLQNILVFKNSANNGRISHALLAENYQKLPVNLTLLYKFERTIDVFIRNFIVFYELNCIIKSKQLKTISIITQHLKAH